MDQEIETYLVGVTRPVDNTLALLEGLTTAQLNWKPPVPESNSLWVLAVHCVGAAEFAVLHWIGGGSVPRDREAEFAAAIDDPAGAAALAHRWQSIKAGFPEALAVVDQAGLLAKREHNLFGLVDGRLILREAIVHAAGHAEEASLTRRLALAAS